MRRETTEIGGEGRWGTSFRYHGKSGWRDDGRREEGICPQERGERRWLFLTRRVEKYARRSYGAHQTSSSPPLQISCPSLTRGQQMEGPSLRSFTNSLPFLSFPLFKQTKEKNYNQNSQRRKCSLGLRGGPTLPYIGPTSGLREGGPTWGPLLLGSKWASRIGTHINPKGKQNTNTHT